jgi:acyl-homoserine lactone acylase PvdQ
MKDVYNANAAYILPKILDIILKNLNIKELQESKFYKILNNWNYEYTKESREATLYSLFERNLCLRLLTKKLSIEKAKPLLNFFPYYNFIYGIIDKIHKGEKIALKECTVYNANDDCEKYIVNVFRHLHEYITDFTEPSGIIKKWGAVNFDYFPYIPFDDIPILNKIFSRKLFVSGGRDTVKISRSSGNNKRGEFVGSQSPRLQFICDMSEPEEPYVMLMGGNDGSPIQRYYNNLMEKFEGKDLIKFKNVDFNDAKNEKRTITLLKKLF